MLIRVLRRSALLTPFLLPLAALAQTPPSPTPASSSPIPDEFTDPDTGARILHLSRLSNAASGVIYFHQPCITADSRYALVRVLDPTAGHTAGYLYRFDFQATTPDQALTKILDPVTRLQFLQTTSNNIYYAAEHDHSIFSTNLFTQATRKIADLPAEWLCDDGITVNSTETLAIGVATLAAEQQKNRAAATTRPNQGSTFNTTFARHDTYILFSANIKTGEVKELHRINTWLGHTQFCPTDPNLIMFCHEGPWNLVDRIWTLRLDAPQNAPAQPQLVFKRSENNEIAGHESWSPDGKTIWFDHNFRARPNGHYLAGKNIATGELTQYHLTADQDCIHYSQSPDMKFFIGDGVAKRNNPASQMMMLLLPDGPNMKTVKLCNMAKTNYTAAEPNPHLTPNQHWAIFTATFFGTPQAYAVELPRQFWR